MSELVNGRSIFCGANNRYGAKVAIQRRVVCSATSCPARPLPTELTNGGRGNARPIPWAEVMGAGGPDDRKAAGWLEHGDAALSARGMPGRCRSHAGRDRHGPPGTLTWNQARAAA